MAKLNNRRRFPGVKGIRPDNYKIKQEEAQERQAAYDNLSLKEKIALLDSRLGKGRGATKQRAKLETASKAPVVAPVAKSAEAIVSVAEKTEAEEPKKLRAKDRRKLEKKRQEEGENE